MSPLVETKVLVIGAGPAGLATSLALANAGVENIVLSKFRSTSPQPRAHIANQRTMEFLRDFGLSEMAKEISTPWESMGDHVFGTSLAGEEFGRIHAWGRSAQAQGAHLAASPTVYCDLPQLYLEPMLLAEAQCRGSEVRFLTEYLSHEQDEEGVTATVRDHVTGTDYQIRAKYLVGADGARSKVASDIGVPFEGEMGLGETGSVNIEFTAELSSLCQHRPGDMYWMLQTGQGLIGAADGPGFGVMRMIRPWNKWVCVVGFRMSDGPPKMSLEDAMLYVRRILGDTNIPVQIDSVSSWANNRQYALSNTKGRVFVMGDATHRHTPFAGLGMNTSIADGYNLAWKLAMVVKGQAGPSLLDSYEQERIPIAKQVVEHAFMAAGQLIPLLQALRLPPGSAQEDMDRSLALLKAPTPEGLAMRTSLRRAIDGTLPGFGSAHGLELNQRYVSTAVVPDSSPDPGFEHNPVYVYQASSRPGAHLPHAWLTRDQRRLSTLDLCGKGKFTLLTGLAGVAWAEPAAGAAKALGIELPVHVIGTGQAFEDSYGEWRRVAEIDEAGAFLVRPDLMIAWRAPDASKASTEQLLPVLRRVLGRD